MVFATHLFLSAYAALQRPINYADDRLDTDLHSLRSLESRLQASCAIVGHAEHLGNTCEIYIYRSIAEISELFVCLFA